MYSATKSAPKRAISLIPVRIGVLLINADLLRPQDMQSALLCARQTGRKLGDVLLTQRLLKPEELQCALELQRMIKDGSVTVELGTKALRSYRENPAPVAELLARLGFCGIKTIGNHDLADILLQANCITQPQLDQARWNAAKNNLPLGRNLVLAGAITPSTLGMALTLLTHVRERTISDEAGIEALKQAVANHVPLADVINLSATASPHHVRVGELLSQAGLLSESDSMMAVEHGLLNRQCIGETLLRHNLISPLVLDAVLKVQNMLDENSISRIQAAELLRQVAGKELALEDCLTAMARLRAQVLELLLESRIISEAQVHQSLSASPSFETDILRALFAAGHVTQETFRAAVRCAYAINEADYTKEQAIAWLTYTFAEKEKAAV